VTPTSKARTLGAYLRTARLKAGLSTHQLAARAHINQSYLVKLETDQNDHPSAETLQRLADTLSLDAAKLLQFIGVKPASVLPSPRVYFRRKLGVNAQQAAVLARLVEDYRQQRKEGSAHDDTQERVP
jgi:transcriptional regulator with XRE-family HTH domain